MPDPAANHVVVPGVDPAAVRGWMVEHGQEPSGELSFDRLGVGQSNLTFRITDAAGRTWVLRRPPLGARLESAHDVVREARIMAALHETSVPVPEIYGVLPRGVVGDDEPAFLMSCEDGVVIDRQETAEAMPPAARRTAGLSLARTLAAVHSVDLATTKLSGLASHEPYAARQIRRWSRQWEQSRTRELPAFDALTARLSAAVGPQHETTLLHGDGHLGNVVTSPETGTVRALLDWELSTLGEPLADLGTLLAYWPTVDEPAMQHFAPSQLAGFATRHDLLTAYADASGRDVSGVVFWHALGLWKVAVIAEGILRRGQDAPEHRAAHQEFPTQRIDVLVEHAHEVAAGIRSGRARSATTKGRTTS